VIGFFLAAKSISFIAGCVERTTIILYIHMKKVNSTTQITFRQKVLDVVAKIPSGQVLTYAEVAQRAGSPKAVRAVGTILSKNYRADVPCHRVIRSDGKIGQYNRGAQKKRNILREEGYLC
jgi:O-6-methylguanine DNA methyltransferase